MKRLKLKNRFQANATILPNEFIDHYMVSANGEFVKVYLLLLRYLNEPGSVLTVSMIADCLNNTENDVLRALLGVHRTAPSHERCGWKYFRNRAFVL